MAASSQQIPVRHWSSPGFVRLSHKPTPTVIGSSLKPLVTSALSKYSLAFSFTGNGEDGGWWGGDVYGGVGKSKRVSFMSYTPSAEHYCTLLNLFTCRIMLIFKVHTHTHTCACASSHVTILIITFVIIAISVCGGTDPSSTHTREREAVFLFTLRHVMKFQVTKLWPCRLPLGSSDDE